MLLHEIRLVSSQIPDEQPNILIGTEVVVG